MNHVDEHALLSMPVSSRPPCRGTRSARTGTAFGRPSGRDMVGKDVKFQKIRRITGYFVGDLVRFNNAKRKEEHDRVKHG